MELMGPELAFGLLSVVTGGRMTKPEGERPEEKPFMDKLREIKHGGNPGNLNIAAKMCAAIGLPENIVKKIIQEL